MGKFFTLYWANCFFSVLVALCCITTFRNFYTWLIKYTIQILHPGWRRMGKKIAFYNTGESSIVRVNLIVYIGPVLLRFRLQQQPQVRGIFPVNLIFSAFTLAFISSFIFLSSANALASPATFSILEISPRYFCRAPARLCSGSLCSISKKF